jgi:hypothetical protein
MPASSLDCSFYIREVPDTSFEDGVFRVSYAIGKQARLDVALPPNVFLKALRAGNRAADAFHEGKATSVVPMRRKDAKPAH